MQDEFSSPTCSVKSVLRQQLHSSNSTQFKEGRGQPKDWMGLCYCSAIYAKDSRRGYCRSSCRSRDPERDGTTGVACTICRNLGSFRIPPSREVGIGSGAPSRIFFDCAGAGQFAGGLATPSSDTTTIATATRDFVHYAESHGVHIKFTHVHSHQGHGLNELADNMAKAGADFLHCSGVPYHLHQAWYQQGTGAAEWAWLMHL